MYIDHAVALKNLRDTLDSCECLHDVLKQYTGSDLWDDIYEDLNANDTLWVMADQNDIKDCGEMATWLREHLESFVECKIFQEHGPAGGWPVVEISCLNMIFYLDWVTE